MEGITAEDSEQLLCPSLNESNWELEYVEVASNKEPHRMDWGWLIEAYHFENEKTGRQLTCNHEVNDHHPKEHTFTIFKKEDHETEDIETLYNRHNWWSRIKSLFRD